MTRRKAGPGDDGCGADGGSEPRSSSLNRWLQGLTWLPLMKAESREKVHRKDDQRCAYERRANWAMALAWKPAVPELTGETNRRLYFTCVERLREDVMAR